MKPLQLLDASPAASCRFGHGCRLPAVPELPFPTVRPEAIVQLERAEIDLKAKNTNGCGNTRLLAQRITKIVDVVLLSKLVKRAIVPRQEHGHRSVARGADRSQARVADIIGTRRSICLPQPFKCICGAETTRVNARAQSRSRRGAAAAASFR